MFSVGRSWTSARTRDAAGTSRASGALRNSCGRMLRLPCIGFRPLVHRRQDSRDGCTHENFGQFRLSLNSASSSSMKRRPSIPILTRISRHSGTIRPFDRPHGTAYSMPHRGRGAVEAMVANGTSKRESFRERIYADLRLRLQRSEFGPDDKLVDVEIASVYGASRMPAREALLQLVNDGYLVGTTRGFRRADPVAGGRPRHLRDPQAARARGPRRTPRAPSTTGPRRRSTPRWRRRERPPAVDDVESLILANIAFRNAWLGCVRNARLAATISALRRPRADGTPPRRYDVRRRARSWSRVSRTSTPPSSRATPITVGDRYGRPSSARRSKRSSPRARRRWRRRRRRPVARFRRRPSRDGGRVPGVASCSIPHGPPCAPASTSGESFAVAWLAMGSVAMVEAAVARPAWTPS